MDKIFTALRQQVVATFARHAPKILPLAQAAYLAVILPRPKAYYHYYEKGALSERMQNRIKHFLGVLRGKGKISQEDYETAAADLNAFKFGVPATADEATIEQSGVEAE